MNSCSVLSILCMLAGLVLHCSTSNTKVTGVEGGNNETIKASLYGRAVGSTGMASAGSIVRIRPSNYLSSNRLLTDKSYLGDSTITDDSGYYHIDSIPPQSYVCEISDRQSSAALRTVVASGTTSSIELGTDTLRAFASIQGVVELPIGSQGSAFVQIYGLERIVACDTSGHFQLSDLPASEYQLRIVPGATDLGAIDISIDSIAPGQSSTLVPVSLPVFGSELYSAWTYSQRVTINTSQAGTTDDLFHYPLCVKLTHSGAAGSLPFNFAQANGKGYDIRFANRHGTGLRYEIETWDSLAGNAVIWVLIDTILTSDSTQGFTMFWGSRNSDADFSNSCAVFDTAQGYTGVWHLSELTPFADATHNRLNAAPGNGIHTTGLGIAGAGRRFEGNGGMRIPDASALEPTHFTISLWFNLDDWQEPFVKLFTKGYTGPPAYQSYSIEYRRPEDKVLFVTARADSSRAAIRENGYTFGNTWYHLAATFNGSTGESRLYLNGLLQGVVTDTLPILYYTETGYDLFIASQEENQAGIKGLLDEVRFCNIPQSESWVRLSYENQRPGSTLLRFAKE